MSGKRAVPKTRATKPPKDTDETTGPEDNKSKGKGGTQVWEIPEKELKVYHAKLEEVQEAIIDLDAQLQKEKAKLNRNMEMALVDLAADAGVPIGTPASVQGRYFVESKEPPPERQVVQR